MLLAIIKVYSYLGATDFALISVSEINLEYQKILWLNTLCQLQGPDQHILIKNSLIQTLPLIFLFNNKKQTCKLLNRASTVINRYFSLKATASASAQAFLKKKKKKKKKKIIIKIRNFFY